ncbi:hypothetical protein KTN05_17420 [Paracoccus sp. Z118]|uniref:hypothetical protein n=1 Tax=Paracoccus sp. Z118 TaxID=2851017 RepID=UPI001C2BB4D6|nr:hypothetical protein [Paracoccus sp. Z118]
MTQTCSWSRAQAEIAFAEAQSQFLARERPIDELDAVAQARAEKTLRLKTARMARDQKEHARVAAPTSSKPSKRA